MVVALAMVERPVVATGRVAAVVGGVGSTDLAAVAGYTPNHSVTDSAAVGGDLAANGEIVAPKSDASDQKCLEIIQKIIEDDMVEKLKVEQCKFYLRKHGLRLTSKKRYPHSSH
ncbi:hypothetical protein Ccrd_010745 [Cynara cardunculus var. scolymus]|uniref:Uncharacterized protein n=1 Tax=Cynara cardunculus var. scolymus TaxID=59895 RepID=A0A124SHX2_CYNCS|nr:hypothetical protein Ccrd_010745 [Cynara cardunculus var. scolymus]